MSDTDALGLQPLPHDPPADQMAGDVDEKVRDEQAKGYVGVKTDPRPNSDYSMEGGAPGITGQPGAPDGGPTTEPAPEGAQPQENA